MFFCYAFVLAAVHPQINPSSRSLQRSVQQLHAWDARRRLTVRVTAVLRMFMVLACPLSLLLAAQTANLLLVKSSHCMHSTHMLALDALFGAV